MHSAYQHCPWRALSRTQPVPTPRCKRHALSILELVIVVMILGIVAAVATPTFHDSLQYNRIDSAARRIKADLEQIRIAARSTSSSQQLTFTDATTYTLSDGVASMAHASGHYVVDLSMPPYSVDKVVVDFASDTTITFNGYGAPTSSGSIVISVGSYKRTITLDDVTGQVQITDNSADAEVSEVVPPL